MHPFEFTEFIPGLPQELALECLTRLHYTAHRAASAVCRRWRQLLKSQDFYHHRKKHGYTHKVACLAQASPGKLVPEGQKPGGSPSYSITVFDPASRNWERVDPIPKYPNGLPLFCQLTSSEGKLIVMGGWDPGNYDPVTDVFVYDFTSREWKQGKDMPSKRSFFAIGCWEGKVLVAGGHDENKNALKSAWVYELGREEWTELTHMSQERDECEGIVIGNKFWVVSGYRTESQGSFEESAESYNLEPGEWERNERAWEAGQCPRSCVGAGQDGRIVNWGKTEVAIQVGTCGVMVGTRGLMIGSEYQGGPQGMYMVEIKQGQKWKLEKIEMSESDEFFGFVQSGCCVEI